MANFALLKPCKSWDEQQQQQQQQQEEPLSTGAGSKRHQLLYLNSVFFSVKASKVFNPLINTLVCPMSGSLVKCGQAWMHRWSYVYFFVSTHYICIYICKYVYKNIYYLSMICCCISPFSFFASFKNILQKDASGDVFCWFTNTGHRQVGRFLFGHAWLDVSAVRWRHVDLESHDASAKMWGSKHKDLEWWCCEHYCYWYQCIKFSFGKKTSLCWICSAHAGSNVLILCFSSFLMNAGQSWFSARRLIASKLLNCCVQGFVFAQWIAKLLIPSGQQTQQWNIPIFTRKSFEKHLQWVHFPLLC